MTKREKEKALKEVDRQLEEKARQPEKRKLPESMFEMLQRLRKKNETPEQEKVFILSESEWEKIRSKAYTADRMNEAIVSFSDTIETIRNYYYKWTDDEISDKTFLNNTLILFHRLSKEQENVEGWAGTLCEIFDFLGWIEDGRPERNMSDDDEVPF